MDHFYNTCAQFFPNPQTVFSSPNAPFGLVCLIMLRIPVTSKCNLWTGFNMEMYLCQNLSRILTFCLSEESHSPEGNILCPQAMLCSLVPLSPFYFQNHTCTYQTLNGWMDGAHQFSSMVSLEDYESQQTDGWISVKQVLSLAEPSRHLTPKDKAAGSSAQIKQCFQGRKVILHDYLCLLFYSS